LTDGVTQGRAAGPSYADRDLGDFLDMVAAREPAPGAGAAAAVSVALAAGLTAMAARFSARQIPDSQQRAEAADDLRRRAVRLADDDAAAYRAVLAVTTGSGEDTDSPNDRRRRRRDALADASQVPIEIAGLGAETARLAAWVAERGNPRLRGDATTAVLIAEAAARAAAHLVAVNVAEGGCDDELVRTAEGSVEIARAAVEKVSGGAPAGGHTG
jgi:formiminotetrahydrofolate cyclodeaminase